RLPRLLRASRRRWQRPMTACAVLPRKDRRSPPQLPRDHEQSPALPSRWKATGRAPLTAPFTGRQPLTLHCAAVISAVVAATCSPPPVFTLSAASECAGRERQPADEHSHAQYHFRPQGGPPDRAAYRDQQGPPLATAQLRAQGRGSDRGRQPQRGTRGAQRGGADDHARGAERRRASQCRKSQGISPRAPGRQARHLVGRALSASALTASSMIAERNARERAALAV